MSALVSFGSQLGPILAAILGFALLVVVHEGGHFLAARLCGMRVERFSVGFGPVLWSRKIGDTLYALSALPLGGYVKIAGMAPGEAIDPADRDAYANQSAWRRLVVIAAGPAMSYGAAILLAFAMLTTVGFPKVNAEPTVGEVLAGSPAARAGLEPGDHILSVSGRPTDSWVALASEVQSHGAEPIEMQVRRGDPRAAPFPVRLTLETAEGKPRLGVTPQFQLVRTGPAQAAVTAVSRSNEQLGAIVSGLVQVAARKQKVELHGPLGVGAEMARSARAGLAPFLWMIWFISIMFALLNLLPFPALDGGRVGFLLFEIVTRRPADQRVEGLVHLAGFVTLVGLMLAVTLFGDLARLLR